MNTLPGCIMVGILLIGCKERTARHPDQHPIELHVADDFEPTERYHGVVDSVDIVFEHEHFTRYRLTEGKATQSGALNTERGFEDDEDATFFILSYDQSPEERRYFIRFTNGTCVMLDADGHETSGFIRVP